MQQHKTDHVWSVFHLERQGIHQALFVVCLVLTCSLILAIGYCDQPPRSTQPGHPFVGRRNESQPKGSDVLRLGSKGRYGSCVGGR